MQDAQRDLPSLDVQLVARRPCERTLPVRAELRVDADVAQQAERASRDGRVAQVEVEGDLAAAAEVEPSRRVEEPGELGEPVAVARRRDARELAPQVFRE